MDLADYYRVLWRLSFSHKYTLKDIQDMLPFERDLFIALIIEELERQKKEAEQQ